MSLMLLHLWKEKAPEHITVHVPNTPTTNGAQTMLYVHIVWHITAYSLQALIWGIYFWNISSIYALVLPNHQYCTVLYSTLVTFCNSFVALDTNILQLKYERKAARSNRMPNHRIENENIQNIQNTYKTYKTYKIHTKYKHTKYLKRFNV